MKKNQKGSALLWALVVIGVLAILIAGSLTITYSYYHRALQTNEKRQAYLTAKGVVEDLAKNIAKGNSKYLSLFMDTSKEEYTPLVKEGETIDLTITLPASATVGKIKESYIKINPIDDTMKGFITIGIVSTYNEQNYEVKADLKLGYINNHGDTWQIIRYYQTGEIQEVVNNITIASKMSDEVSYLYDLSLTKGYPAVKEYMLNDAGWKNIPADKKTEIEKIGYFNDFTIRTFLCYRNESNTFPEFNKDEIKNKELVVPVAETTTVNGVVSTKIVKKNVNLEENNFYNKSYYIQPKYSNLNKTVQFIYAGEKNTLSNGGDIHLFYYNGGWFYLDKVSFSDNGEAKSLVPTSLDDEGATKLQYLIDHYLTEDNKVQ